MEWSSVHAEELAGGILVLVGVVSMLFPRALLPRKHLDKLKKINFTGQRNPSPRKARQGDEEFPLALGIFLRATGFLFALAGAAILLARC